MTHQLPQLPFEFNALEPHFDAKTMEIHHGKHHAGYVAKLNAALEGTGQESTDLDVLLGQLDQLAQDKRGAVRNNGGGHLNHTLFWSILTPESTQPSAELSDAINQTFGSMDQFKAEFNDAAATRFGSGWAWLSVNPSGQLVVSSTPNQDNPIMDGNRAILGLDVWEHAYYLNYQNRRPDYISAFWNVVNWNKVSELYAAARSVAATTAS